MIKLFKKFFILFKKDKSDEHSRYWGIGA